MRMFLFIILIVILPVNAFATVIWTNQLTDWLLYMDNGVVYVKSDSLPSNCSYARAQIIMDNTAYNNALYAYILSAYKTGKPIRVVTDNATTVCVISGVQDN
ncbi:MAG: hypothetical protein COA47_14865 [Robiginitomaculum sp.]|nr:MAG: hypothetical protein COA47_14865 [Robiginitomaculum sp.]